jgi:hypothetical protein
MIPGLPTAVGSTCRQITNRLVGLQQKLPKTFFGRFMGAILELAQ